MSLGSTNKLATEALPTLVIMLLQKDSYLSTPHSFNSFTSPGVVFSTQGVVSTSPALVRPVWAVSCFQCFFLGCLFSLKMTRSMA